MSSTNPVENFFDRLAPNWDEHADDDLQLVCGFLLRAGIKEGDKVLDLACGTGVITGLIHELTHEDVLGLDLSGEMIARAKAKYEGVGGVAFAQGDFLTFEGGRYDAIILYNAYPHFVEPRKLSWAFAKHLNEDGIFLICHSFGRDRLKKHHEGLSSNISRDIESPQEEFTFFQNEFNLLLAEEDGNHYLLAGKRK